MEALIVLLVLVLLAIPLLLIVALVMIAGLRRRVAALEQRAAGSAWETPPAPAEPERPLRWADIDSVDTVAAPLDVAMQPGGETPVETADSVAAPAAAAMPPPLPFAASIPPRPAPPVAPVEPQGPGIGERIVGTLKQWFTEGNVPVKIGMLVLLAGVAALLKYASDQGWLNAPIELRLAAIAVAALAGLVFGWVQRDTRRMFALALQGGAIGILLLTIFAAFKRYDLMPAAPAFVLSVLLIAGMGVLAGRSASCC